MSDSLLRDTTTVWLRARGVIVTALRDIVPSNESSHWYEHNAAAIIARLAKERLLICTPEEMKDD